MNTAAVLKNATCCQAPSLRAQLTDLWRAVFKDMFSSYRPEKHYMRGPGPKWLERHARTKTQARARGIGIRNEEWTSAPTAIAGR